MSDTPNHAASRALDRPAGDLVADLTLAEKASLTSGASFWGTKPVERAGIPGIVLTDGPHGVRLQRGSADHLGIGDSVPATCFPPAVALGSTFDPELLERVGRALGEEARALGVGVLLGPGINIKRSPLCGRNFEYLSEDPLVSGELGAALVRGLQAQGVGASLKHFAANNQESDRMRVSADVDPRPLREIYLRGFQRVVQDARPWTVMCSYNRINGVYASEDPWLLTRVLRDEWGFEGLVVSDWGAVNDRVEGLPAGLDLEMPASGGRTDAQLVDAVEAGRLDVSFLDLAARRAVELVQKAVAGADPAATGEVPAGDVDAHHALAREAAARGAVLLKNDGGILPLDAGQRVAVIGEFARTPRYQGAGSSLINPTRLDTALAEIERLADDGRVGFAAGFTVEAPELVESPEPVEGESLRRAQRAGEFPELVEGESLRQAQQAGEFPELVEGESLGRAQRAGEFPEPVEGESLGRAQRAGEFPELVEGESLRRAQRAEAVAEASAADVVLLFLGLPAADESEGFDREHLRLPAEQLDLLDAVRAANPNVVVVLANGGVVELPFADDVPAIVEGWLGGQAGGGGIADVLYGVVNPSGRLAETIPYRLEDTPAFLDFPGEFGHVRYGEGIFVGYRWYDARDTAVRFPFGHGLSYTTFAYSALTVSAAADGGLDVRVTVTNTGDRAGREVVQVYTGIAASRVQRAPRSLAGFASVEIEAGASREVAVHVRRDDLAYWDVRVDRWVVEGGDYDVSVAASSRDIRLTTTAAVVGDEVRLPLSFESSVADLMADPVAGPIVAQAMAGLASGLGDTDVFGDEGMAKMMASFPVGRLVSFPGVPVTFEQLEQLIAAANTAH
ncbi:glycoside hydrolase family 3 C-terminal domain-containing protein [Agromyces larvae]|uniref:Glycoside hydrolase family 3 C-terminal domain-containing protein n=1 Tax=Agromyces larvae TaxID=2929802 RepID=A0ABY4BZM6_9MICO|nr:glycoside hydrolase family 3 C-terminal domain-containing protein [Agromyces larvae]UOE43637.1 glycoside hydrolase family 3 C-terminal domain-containing protein [Agromyces larvae]